MTTDHLKKMLELNDRYWSELMDAFDGDEYRIEMAVHDLWERKIKYHLQLSAGSGRAPETRHSEVKG